MLLHWQSTLLSLISSLLNYLGKVLVVTPQITYHFARWLVHVLVQRAVLLLSLATAFLFQTDLLGSLQSVRCQQCWSTSTVKLVLLDQRQKRPNTHRMHGCGCRALTLVRWSVSHTNTHIKKKKAWLRSAAVQRWGSCTGREVMPWGDSCPLSIPPQHLCLLTCPCFKDMTQGGNTSMRNCLEILPLKYLWPHQKCPRMPKNGPRVAAVSGASRARSTSVVARSDVWSWREAVVRTSGCYSGRCK